MKPGTEYLNLLIAEKERSRNNWGRWSCIQIGFVNSILSLRLKRGLRKKPVTREQSWTKQRRKQCWLCHNSLFVVSYQDTFNVMPHVLFEPNTKKRWPRSTVSTHCHVIKLWLHKKPRQSAMEAQTKLNWSMIDPFFFEINPGWLHLPVVGRLLKWWLCKYAKQQFNNPGVDVHERYGSYFYIVRNISRKR